MIAKSKDEPSSEETWAIPLQSVRTFINVHESLVHVSLLQKFVNPTESKTVELTYRFPKIKGSIISSLSIKIG